MKQGGEGKKRNSHSNVTYDVILIMERAGNFECNSFYFMCVCCYFCFDVFFLLTES